MTLYSTILFLHVLGMLGLVTALGIEWVLLRYVARAGSREEAQACLRPTAVLPPLAIVSMALLLISGIYLGIHLRAGDEAWVRASLFALLFIAALGIFTGRRMRALRRASSEIRELVNDPRLQTPMRIRFSVLLGIVFVMVVHANLALSLSTMGAALAVGLVWSAPAWKVKGPATGPA
jgi:uncharacterized membrane protein